ncbi:short-chain dehydrogenase [Lipomyces orientalis]|uniref:Short-chain dehydrogenase n=1 Tax=Lipomyces orientalis TaxID=1233043 RepID=A0ACC3TEU2_9ASCO
MTSARPDPLSTRLQHTYPMAAPRKSVLITGCSAGGIGAALAEVFHEKGYYVFATVRNRSKISETLSSAANVTILTLDVLSSESIAAAVESVKRETGSRLDVLVNNSGGGSFVPALDAPVEEGKKLFDLNFWAPLAMLQAFAPLLIKAKGRIVNNSSANAYIPMPLMSMYNSSKAALAMASETWRHELQPLGVRTITLVTCAVKTNFFNDYHGAELPETSNYTEIRDFIRNLTDGRLQANAISSRHYAVKVVREVEKGTVGTVWAGTDAFFIRLALWLSPQSVIDRIVESVVPFSSEMAKAAQKKKV